MSNDFVLRFHNIQQKISEGERTCDLLLLACLTSLRCSLDVAAEGKRGEAYIDQLCLELEDGDAKRGKKKKKKERKNKDMSDDIEKRDDCRECRSSVESCLDEEEDREGNVICSFSVAVCVRVGVGLSACGDIGSGCQSHAQAMKVLILLNSAATLTILRQ